MEHQDTLIKFSLDNFPYYAVGYEMNGAEEMVSISEIYRRVIFDMCGVPLQSTWSSKIIQSLRNLKDVLPRELDPYHLFICEDGYNFGHFLYNERYSGAPWLMDSSNMSVLVPGRRWLVLVSSFRHQHVDPRFGHWEYMPLEEARRRIALRPLSRELIAQS